MEREKFFLLGLKEVGKLQEKREYPVNSKLKLTGYKVVGA